MTTTTTTKPSVSKEKETVFIGDELDEDPPFSSAKYVGISFLSPEKILKQREQFYFQQFVKVWDLNKSMQKYNDFLHFMVDKYNLSTDAVFKDFNEFLKEEEGRLKAESVYDDYKTYIENHEDTLMQQFQKENGFQTSVRGLKIRTPTYGSLEEAEEMVNKIRERDPTHDIYIGAVGKWMPWDPDAYKTGRMEFMEPELNRLHHEKTKNEAKAKAEFEQRVRDTKRKAILENIKLAEKSNNVLTQTIDENDNLIGVRETVDFESREEATDDMKEKQRNEILAKHSK
jgi:hypothetical protein